MALIPKIVIPLAVSAAGAKSGAAEASRHVGAFARSAAQPIALAVDVSPAVLAMRRARVESDKTRAVMSKPVSIEIDKAPAAASLKSVRADAAHTAAELGKGAAMHVVSEKATSAVVGANPGYGAFAAGKTAVDLGANKAADVAVGISTAGMKAGLATAEGVLKVGVKALTSVATIPLTVAHIGLKIGMAVAQAFVFKKIKEITGASTVQLVVGYAVLRVGLAVAKRMVSAAVGAMTRVAVVPFKVALGALRAGLNAAKALARGAARQIRDVLSIPLKIGSMAAGIGLAGGVLGGLVGIPAALAGSVKAASDLNEAISKVEYGFKDSAPIIMKGADKLADKFGLVKITVLDAAAGFAQVGKAAGLTDEKAAKLGVDMTKLAADLSSRDNLPFGLALEKIRAGLVGEAEPLRTVGVLLSETAVKAKASALGFASVKGELSESSKVLARMRIIQEQLVSASGDLERTQTSLANSLREAAGRIQNLAASIGEFLLPAAQSLSGTLNTVIRDVEKMAKAKSATFQGWGGQLKSAADMAGVLWRNLGKFAEIGKLTLGDLPKHLAAVGKSLFDNLINFGSYFAKVLGQQVEKAVQTALHRAFEGSSFDPGKYEQKVQYLPPKFQAPKFESNPQIGEVFKQIQAAEVLHKAKDVGSRVGAGAVTALSAAREANKFRQQQTKSTYELLKGQTAVASTAGINTPAPEPKTRAARVARMVQERDLEKAKNTHIHEGVEAGGKIGAVLATSVAGVAGLAMAKLNERSLGGLPIKEGMKTGFHKPGEFVGPPKALVGMREKTEAAEPRFAGLAEAGSKEAYSAIIRHGGGGGRNDDSRQTAKNTGELVKKTDMLIEAIRAGSGGRGLSAFTF